ncbi:MAG: MBL fold metallo-hydrolase, partial [Candidatus Eremiobacteraeota bacterium]|nr:MBL fold metallo-hydrolase [Candidatus Eremiobacteraeota bacterium]
PERGLHTTALYTDKDVDAVMPLFKDVAYEELRNDIPGCAFRMHDAGHILGSAITELIFEKHTLTYTGDLGRYGRPLLRDPGAITTSDYVLCEATYGDRVHPQNDPQDDLGKVILAAQQRKGVLVIPSFAVGRTQEILYAIGQLQQMQKIPSVKIYVDSPMAIAADAIMERHPEATRFSLRERFGPNDTSIGAQNVTTVTAASDSIALNNIASGAIIIASSGMASGGRVLHHLRNRLSRPNDTVCFVGFQGPGTIGSFLRAGQKNVRIMGVPVPVNVHIEHIDGFSAHADRNELLRWFANFTDKPATYLVHADPNAAASLAAVLHEQDGLQTHVAAVGEVLQL